MQYCAIRQVICSLFRPTEATGTRHPLSIEIRAAVAPPQAPLHIIGCAGAVEADKYYLSMLYGVYALAPRKPSNADIRFSHSYLPTSVLQANPKEARSKQASSPQQHHPW